MTNTSGETGEVSVDMALERGDFMYRGTTPTLVFRIPYAAALVQGGYVTLAQLGAVQLEKAIGSEGVTLEDERITVTLTQAETLALSTAAQVRIQLRLLLTGGTAVASNIMHVQVEEILKEGEI
jgi:hypothetical protein